LIQLSECSSRYNEIKRLLHDKHVTRQSYGGYTRSIILPRLVTQNTRGKKTRSRRACSIFYEHVSLILQPW